MTRENESGSQLINWFISFSRSAICNFSCDLNSKCLHAYITFLCIGENCDNGNKSEKRRKNSEKAQPLYILIPH